MKPIVPGLLVLVCLMSVVAPSYGTDSKRVNFPGLDDKSLFAVVEKGKTGKFHFSVAGVSLQPESDTYLEMIDEGFLSGSLSPDKERILVSLGHIDEKNVWVVNLKTKQLEFASHDNPARHVFPRWHSSTSFELMYGGMAYRVEREYSLRNGSWKMTRDQTIEEQ